MSLEPTVREREGGKCVVMWGVENVGENKTPQVMGCIKGQGVADSVSLSSRTSLKSDVITSSPLSTRGEDSVRAIKDLGWVSARSSFV